MFGPFMNDTPEECYGCKSLAKRIAKLEASLELEIRARDAAIGDAHDQRCRADSAEEKLAGARSDFRKAAKKIIRAAIEYTNLTIELEETEKKADKIRKAAERVMETRSRLGVHDPHNSEYAERIVDDMRAHEELGRALKSE